MAAADGDGEGVIYATLRLYDSCDVINAGLRPTADFDHFVDVNKMAPVILSSACH